MRRHLTPLEEHQAWIFRHGGWRKTIEAEREAAVRDFSEAPIKLWLDRYEKDPELRREVSDALNPYANRRQKVKA